MMKIFLIKIKNNKRYDMKYSFTISAILAITTYAQSTETETETEKLFEKNEDGQFQLVWPKQPAISVTDADDQAVMAWFEGKMAESTALDMEFVQAYKDYQSAISQPYNDFLTQVEDLTVRGMQMGAKNDQEIFTWIA